MDEPLVVGVRQKGVQDVAVELWTEANGNKTVRCAQATILLDHTSEWNEVFIGLYNEGTKATIRLPFFPARRVVSGEWSVQRMNGNEDHFRVIIASKNIASIAES